MKLSSFISKTILKRNNFFVRSFTKFSYSLLTHRQFEVHPVMSTIKEKGNYIININIIILILYF